MVAVQISFVEHTSYQYSVSPQSDWSTETPIGPKADAFDLRCREVDSIFTEAPSWSRPRTMRKSQASASRKVTAWELHRKLEIPILINYICTTCLTTTLVRPASHCLLCYPKIIQLYPTAVHARHIRITTPVSTTFCASASIHPLETVSSPSSHPSNINPFRICLQSILTIGL